RNAIKFTPSGGRIVLSAARRDGAVEFAVKDSGRGISSENQTRIFDRYWQSSDGARARGSGLGLSIAKGIVEAHGGHIRLESARDAGSLFAFTVPASAAPIT